MSDFEMSPAGGFPPRMLALPAGVAAPRTVSKLKRLCRFPGCGKVIKSQGLCQRHGARAKRCRVEGCEKQAQGTHDGMCKRHWKSTNFPQLPAPEEERQMPVGESAYDTLLPKSIAYRPDGSNPKTLMPLIVALKEGFQTKEPGWHRNAERLARGLLPTTSLTNQFEFWEKQMVWAEMLLLSGGTPGANFDHLAHAWGREHNFHLVLIQTICSRRGDLGRKRRADASLPMAKHARLSPSSPSRRSQLLLYHHQMNAHNNNNEHDLGDDDVVPNVDGDPDKPTENIYLQAARIMAADDDDDDEEEEENDEDVGGSDDQGDEVVVDLMASPVNRSSSLRGQVGLSRNGFASI